MHRHPPSSSRWSAPRVEEIENKAKRILPDDFTKDVPARCWEWLLQYGLPYDYWKELVGYSERYERLIFRVGNPLQFSLGRLLPVPTQSLETTSSAHGHGRKWHVWGDAHKHVEVINPINGGSIILVEDLISAHKVGQVAECVPLFGTQVSPAVLYYLKQRGYNIIVWLDEDQRDTMPRVCNRLSVLTGLPVDYISTAKDPKELSISSISNYITKFS